ncbi:MAG: ABC transporter ATP-binding protein [Firmicutes bacterium]|nr:ABC transporter ATP-binding protein [Bacillota bacterium]
MSLPILELRHVVKKYRVGKEVVTALDDVDLSVQAGEFVAILGTSGSGKTTLLNVAAGLEKPTRGDVIFRGTVLNKLKERQKVVFRRKQMGFIFQSYNLLPTMTAQENVALPLIFDGVPVRERLKRAVAVLTIMGLKERRMHKPMEMSGGQQQRVSIARALVHNPRIIFADELTGNLDSHTTNDIMRNLKETICGQGQTLIMVTHDHDVAKFADRIIFMVDGKIVSEERGGHKNE